MKQNYFKWFVLTFRTRWWSVRWTGRTTALTSSAEQSTTTSPNRQSKKNVESICFDEASYNTIEVNCYNGDFLCVVPCLVLVSWKFHNLFNVTGFYELNILRKIRKLQHMQQCQVGSNIPLCLFFHTSRSIWT